MGKDRPEAQGSGTWGSREAAAEWRRGAAARLEALGPATEMMLELAGVKTGSRVLDVGAGAGDSALMAARRTRPTGHVLATDVSASMLEIAAASGPCVRFLRCRNLSELPDADPRLSGGSHRDPAGSHAGWQVRRDRLLYP